MKNNKIIALALIGTLFLQSNIASATTTTTVVNGNISATIIDVSVPTALAFSVDPNLEESTISSVAEIKNNTLAPITVSIGVGSNFTQSSTSEWKPMDYLPTDLEWDKLGKEETENSLALGVKIVDASEWREVIKADTLWALEQKNSVGEVVFGELDAKSSAKLTLDVKTGRAFSMDKNCVYNIIWTFELAK